MPPLPMPDDWQRALVVAAHPDDIEHGAAAAVAVWTAAGKEVHYLLATRGEAAIAGISPAEAGPPREDEERRSAAVVGVSEVEFLATGTACWRPRWRCAATWPPRSAGTGRSWC